MQMRKSLDVLSHGLFWATWISVFICLLVISVSKVYADEPPVPCASTSPDGSIVTAFCEHPDVDDAYKTDDQKDDGYSGIIGALKKGFLWLGTLLLAIPRWLFCELLKGVAGLLCAVPVPDAFNNIVHFNGTLPAYGVWAFDSFAVGQCVLIISSCMLARFFIRRIPLIG